MRTWLWANGVVLIPLRKVREKIKYSDSKHREEKKTERSGMRGHRESKSDRLYKEEEEDL